MTATATAKARSAGAKTARACDICLRTRARWFCAADDAFLCQKCDSTVHAANSVAHRHERVRLKTPPSVNSRVVSDEEPTWHHGFKRKARTPRGGGGKEERRTCSSGPVVPELGTPSEEEEEEEESSNPSMVVDEGELIYRVPIYDPMLSEFCSPPPPATPNDEVKPEGIVSSGGGLSSEFLTPDTDLREFEIDMERLLGGVLEEESFCMEGLGFHGGGGVEEYYSPAAEEYNPLKEEEEMYVDDSSGLTDVKYDCGSPWTSGRDSGDVADGGGGRQRGVKLKLDYESVISAWSTQGSPWADGERPKLDSGDCFPDFMGMMVWVGGAEFQGGGGMVTGGGGCHGGVTQTYGGDGGREARVSRYREKRRTRLFSKKIRYEVRKLNAEKRPRMKGRFVKRTTSANAVAAKPQFVF